MIHRRTFLSQAAAAAIATLHSRGNLLARELLDSGNSEWEATPASGTFQEKRFPFFKSTPVSYRHVKMQDQFWAPRQISTREVSVPWITKAHDSAGGIETLRAHPHAYRAGDKVVNVEAIKFIEAMATVVGLQRDEAIESLIDAWVERVRDAQGVDGYLEEHFPPGLDHPSKRWQAVWWSHEAYTTGSYIESAIAYREATGNHVMYESAIRTADHMTTELLGKDHPYTSGHPEIEQALMRLYGVSGEVRYLRLCAWLLEQRGHHDGRPSFGRYSQDDIPLKDQRTIEGHAVRAAYLWNGVTQYVGATGDPDYRKAALAVWDDFVNHKMYLHGAGGNQSSINEGYRKEPYCILPEDTYGESCSVFANFQWAHSLARLTGDAHYIDTAERMLYNAFYASLSLKGDASFHCNVSQVDAPTPRDPKEATTCCPPNIVKLFNKVGEFFYSTGDDGIYVNHFGASEADIPWGEGVKLTQRTGYPWDGAITIQVEPKKPQSFAMRLRVPQWANSYTLSLNGRPVTVPLDNGWLVVRRRWRAGDHVSLDLPMEVRRVTMPPEFKEYGNRAALMRGPIVYCLEEQDLQGTGVNDGYAAIGNWPIPGLATLYIPEDGKFVAEHLHEFLGGVTVLHGEVRQLKWAEDTARPVSAPFVPYGVWANRTPGAMRIWLGARRAPLVDLLLPALELGESCVG